jgi:hypothetical protein
MSGRCFIAIATGQNVANVAPLLAVARRGDVIVFVETAEATRQGWVNPAIEVLARHDLTAARLVVGSDEPAELYRAVRAHRWPGGRRVIIGNGGTKPQSAALYEALRDSQPALLYSLDRPCVLQWYENGPAKPARVQAYGKTPLTLEDILPLRGMRLEAPPAALYLAGALTAEGRALAAISEGYGFEPGPTFALHDAHARRKAERARAGSPPKLPRWADLQYLVDAQDWQPYLSACAQVIGQRPEAATGRNVQQVKDLFNAAARLLERALMPQTRERPPAPVGAAFERALAARLCAVLAEPGMHTRAIQGVWRNVKVDSPRAPGVIQLETDLLILLKNGLLIAIEAKSHTAENKDLDARLLSLQRAGSQLARVVVCSPLYTLATDGQWFRTHHEFAQRVRRHGFTHLAYTLPGQPDHYALVPEGETGAPAEVVPVVPFEAACRNLLEGYAPPLA